MNLASIARALGGVVSGRQVLAPGPGHSKHDRSLAVFLDPHAPDLFRVHSHSPSYTWQDGRDHVKACLGITDTPRRQFAPRAPRPVPAADDHREKVARALNIFDAAMQPSGTLVEVYLASRGLTL